MTIVDGDTLYVYSAISLVVTLELENESNCDKSWVQMRNRNFLF